MPRADAAGRQLAEALLDAMPDPAARRAAETVLRAWAGVTCYLPRLGALEPRQRAAQALAEAGASPCDAVRILRERFGVSERTARRYLRQARTRLKES